MRRALIATFCAVIFAAPVLAEDGPVCLFSDPIGSSCNFTDTGGLMEFYVIHQPDASVTAIQFAAPVPGCMTGASWVADTNPYLALGNSQTGLSVAYAGCVSGPIHVSTIQVATAGLTTADCPYPVIPDPAAPTGFIEVIDCAGNKHLGQGGTAYVNSAIPCKCGPGPGDPVLNASPLVVDFLEDDDVMPLTISNIGAGTLNWEVIESLPWLNAVPMSGTGGQAVALYVDRFGLQMGHYTETLWVASNGGNATVTIELEVGSNAILGVNPTSLHFSENDVLKVLTVFNSGTGPLNWSIDPPLVGWLSVDPDNAAGTTRVDVIADRTGLAPGVYNTSLHVTSDGGEADVPVQLVVGFPPILGYSPTSVDFGTSSSSRSLSITNDGNGILSWSVIAMAPWLAASPHSGVQDGTVYLTANRNGLPPGTHTTLVDISSNGGNAQIPVSLIVPAPAPALGVSPGSLSFALGQTQGFLTIFNAGTGTLVWDVASSEPWMSVTPDSGVGDGSVSVSVDRTGLPDGNYGGFVQITSNGGNASIPVALVVNTTPILYVTPALLQYDNATTARSFAISNVGQGTLDWQLSDDQTWIEIDPPLAGSGNATVVVRVDLTQISGTQVETGLVTVTSNGGVETVEVRYSPPTPQLSVNPALLLYDNFITTRSFAITNSGTGTLDWQLSADKTWIEIDPPLTGTGSATVTVRIDLNQISGNQAESGLVTVASNGGVETVEIRYTLPTGGGDGGVIGLYGDAGFSSCNVVNPVSVFTLYVAHELTPGTTASQFSITTNPGMIFLADQVMGGFLSIGDSQNGIALSYSACQSGPIHIMSVLYHVTTPAPCSTLQVVPDPNALTGQIEGVDCALHKTFPNGGILTINSDGSCSCGVIVAVETKTWGGVKALYAPDAGENR